MNELIRSTIRAAMTDISLGFQKRAIGRLEWILANEKLLETAINKKNKKVRA